jgi:hypothetical protein
LPLETPTVHIREPALVAASWRELFFVLWLGPSGSNGPEMVRAVVSQQRALVRRLRGRKMAKLSLVSSSVTLPDAKTRQAVDASRDLDPYTKAEVVILPASGFVRATVRSLIAGIMLVRPPPCPTTILDGLDAAFAWMAPRLDPDAGQAITPATLAAAYASLAPPARR